jgi:acyl-CoA thioesterase FadM
MYNAETEELICIGTTEWALIDIKKQRPAKITDEMYKRLWYKRKNSIRTYSNTEN